MNNQTSKVKILVVEDEILLAQDISNRLEDLNYEVVGIANSVEGAVQLIEENNTIDLILLDIVLKGKKDGIDLASIINQRFQIPFIFLTSHADAALIERAKTVNPHAYILKPFNGRQVGIAIELALINFSNKTPEKDLLKTQSFEASENQVLQIKDCLFLKKDHHFKRVALKDIQIIQADSNYSTIYTSKDRFVYSIVLKKIEEQLPLGKFIRTHRSYIVSIQSIDGFGGNMLFIGDKKIPISKTYKKEVFKLFRTI